jgi:hypothetical protein
VPNQNLRKFTLLKNDSIRRHPLSTICTSIITRGIDTLNTESAVSKDFKLITLIISITKFCVFGLSFAFLCFSYFIFVVAFYLYNILFSWLFM